MSKPQSHRHHEHSFGNLPSCASRHPARDTSRGTQISPSIAPAAIPRYALAAFVLGPTREGLVKQFVDISTRHGIDVDPRVLLGQERGSRIRAYGCGYGLALRLQPLRLLMMLCGRYAWNGAFGYHLNSI
jgi:hypothetical protein